MLQTAYGNQEPVVAFFIKMVKGMWPTIHIVLTTKRRDSIQTWQGMESCKANPIHIFMVVLGRYCSPGPSSWKKGRCHQANR